MQAIQIDHVRVFYAHPKDPQVANVNWECLAEKNHRLGRPFAFFDQWDHSCGLIYISFVNGTATWTACYKEHVFYSDQSGTDSNFVYPAKVVDKFTSLSPFRSVFEKVWHLYPSLLIVLGFRNTTTNTYYSWFNSPENENNV